jgi:hypothetical protein
VFLFLPDKYVIQNIIINLPLLNKTSNATGLSI